MKPFLLCLSLLAFACIKANVVSLSITTINQPPQTLTLSGCDTLEIINTSGLTDYFTTDTLSNGAGDQATSVYPDATSGTWGNGTSYFYNLNTYTTLYVSHQFFPIFYYLAITPCPTAVNEAGAKAITWNIFPNPAAEILSIEFPGAIRTVELLTVTGELIETVPGNAAGAISLAGLSPGIYLVRVIDRDGRQFTRKLIRKD